MMIRRVPEIHISKADPSPPLASDYESQSDAATEYEFIKMGGGGPPRHAAVHLRVTRHDDAVILTDVEGSSDDEDDDSATAYPSPLDDCVEKTLDIGMSSECVSNSQTPNKTQKSVICLLENSKFKVQTNRDDYGTDTEGLNVSEDEIFQMDGFGDIQIKNFDPEDYVSISEKVLSGTIVSPAVTPEPGYSASTQYKRRLSVTPQPIMNLTDSEYLISDAETSSTLRTRRTIRQKSSQSLVDRANTDSDDSDVSLRNPRHCRRSNKTIVSSKSWESLGPKSLSIHPRKKSEEPLTDVEFFEEFKRPTVIHKNKSVRQRPIGRSSPKKTNKLNVAQFNQGNVTDVETFDSDLSDTGEPVKPVMYIPDTTCELVISNENNIGELSLILPLPATPKNKMNRSDLDNDCGYSDVEDLPGYIGYDFVRYPTPDFPRPEGSIVQNRESVISNALLNVKTAKQQEPMTEVEDIMEDEPRRKNQLKLNSLKVESEDMETHTDVEDLGSDTEDHYLLSAPKIRQNEQPVTDTDEISGSDDDMPRFVSVSPDIHPNETYITTRETLAPFLKETRRRLVEEPIPIIRTISPSPIFYSTDQEDMVVSQDESVSSRHSYSRYADDRPVEDHNSVVHIQNSRRFETEGSERAHIKGEYYHSDPHTDSEEVSMADILEEVKCGQRSQHKRKELEDSSVKILLKGNKEMSCKWTGNGNSSNRHEERQPKLEKAGSTGSSKERKDEENFRDLASGYTGAQPNKK